MSFNGGISPSLVDEILKSGKNNSDKLYQLQKLIAKYENIEFADENFRNGVQMVLEEIKELIKT